MGRGAASAAESGERSAACHVPLRRRCASRTQLDERAAGCALLSTPRSPCLPAGRAAKSKQQFTQELQGLDASVKALELQVSELRAWVKAESASLPKVGAAMRCRDAGACAGTPLEKRPTLWRAQVEALLKACQLQAGDLHLLAAHLPTHLPSALPPPQQPTRAAGPASDTGGAADQDAGRARPSAVGAGKAGAAAGTRRQGGGGGAAAAHGGPPPPAPRCFITEQELAGVAAYMKGRLTTDKVGGRTLRSRATAVPHRVDARSSPCRVMQPCPTR